MSDSFGGLGVIERGLLIHIIIFSKRAGVYSHRTDFAMAARKYSVKKAPGNAGNLKSCEDSGKNNKTKRGRQPTQQLHASSP